ncbi:MAG: hypothetical protein LBP81_06685 [Treponema sp.]|nr:hypothetical protein [Treponema sp.]
MKALIVKRARRGVEIQAFILAIPIFLAPAIACGLENKDFDKYVSVSVQPWANWVFMSGPYLDYRLKPSVFTTVELSLEYKKYLKLFFDVDINANDNFVGELADSKVFTKIAGMLGFKNCMLRAAWGQIEGEVVWKGPLVPGQPQSATVSTKYAEVALLYNWSPLFLGIMYQNYHIPVAAGGFSFAYDDNMVFNYYGVYFGTQTYKAFMEERQGKKKPAFGMWLDSALSIGAAVGDISAEAKRRQKWGEVIAEDMMKYGNNPITTHGDSAAALSGNGQIIAGVLGAVNIRNLTLGFGVGYDGFVQGYWTSNYTATLIRHGGKGFLFVLTGPLKTICMEEVHEPVH